jgi:hypothetical protein
MKLSQRAARLLPLLAVAMLVACGITSITGPATVTIGQNAMYNYAWSYGGVIDPPNAVNGIAEVTIAIPNGWTVVSATYDGSINGSPVSGTASPTTPPGCITAAAGYQLVAFSAGPFATSTAGDGGTFHVTYTIGGVAGTYTMEASGSATTSTMTHACGDFVLLPIVVADAGAIPTLDPRVLVLLVLTLAVAALFALRS